jgi:Flp pilus assembly protein CpaB
MELEYKDDRRKGRFVILLGLVLALVAGGVAFYTVNQAQQNAGQSGAKRVSVVTAVATIAARAPIKAADVALREVPLDDTNANGVITDPNLVVGRIAAVTILQGQLVTTNMLASTTEGAPFSVLRPDETVSPDSELWRAVAITVPDDLAVGGMLAPGQNVDVFVTAIVNVPEDPTGTYMSDRSTKIVYQNMVILARKEAFYVVRASLPVAEEIAHLQATGSATFSFALRPVEDQREIDATALGETNNRIIEKYGLPIPETIQLGTSPRPSPSASATPIASAPPVTSPAPSGSPAASGTPAPSASPKP